MNQTAEKITPIEEGKDLILFGNALDTFDIKEVVIVELEEATKLEITDAKSETVVRKFRQNTKSLQVKTEKHRLKLNREYKEKTDAAAGLLIPRLIDIYDKLDAKVKAVEAVKAEKKAEADRIKAEVDAQINILIGELDALARWGLQYNRSADQIAGDLGRIEIFEISSSDFGDRTEEAERVKADGIASTQIALENRIQWEADQAEAARVKEAQEAEAKKLAQERAEFEKARVAEREKQAEIQARLDLEREVKDREQAETLRKQQEQLERDRKALEDQQAAIEKQKADAAWEKYLVGWDAAIEINRIIIPEIAIQMNASFDLARAEDEKVRIEQLKKDKVRAKIIKSDQEKIQAVINQIDKMLAGISSFDYDTDEGGQIIVDLYVSIKTALDVAEKAGAELV